MCVYVYTCVYTHTCICTHILSQISQGVIITVVKEFTKYNLWRLYPNELYHSYKLFDQGSWEYKCNKGDKPINLKLKGKDSVIIHNTKTNNLKDLKNSMLSLYYKILAYLL